MTEEKKQPLTKAQEQVFEKIRSTKGGYLRAYPKSSGNKSWRLMDESQNPIRVFSDVIISHLLSKEYLKRQDHIIILNEAA